MIFRINQGFFGRYSKLLLGIALTMVCELSVGQTLADLDWVVVGPTRQVARISFNANVRFLRQAPVGDADLVQISFDIVGNDDSILGQTIEEGRRLDRENDRPGFSLTYVPAPALRTKTLTLRLTRKARILARQGPDGRTIDVVFGNSETGSVLPAMPDAPEDRRFALVLKSFPTGSTDALPKVPGEFEHYAVFTRPVDEGGTRRKALALGYFRSKEDAEIVRKRASAIFPTARVYDLASESKLTPHEADVVPAPAVANSKGKYGVLLRTFSATDLGAMPRIPADFQDYAVITRSLEEGGVKLIALAIGYFHSEKEAESVRQRAAARFPGARVFDLTPQVTPSVAASVTEVSKTEPRLAVVPTLVPAPNSPQDTPPAVLRPAQEERSNVANREEAVQAFTPTEIPTTSEVTSKAAELVAKGRKAITDKRLADAVDPLNQALMLPPNPSSQEAQELIGYVWEGLNQPSKALIEYKLYLRLYPQSESAPKVAGRVAELSDKTAANAKPAENSEKDQKSRFDYSGSISQYYYGGQTKSESLVNIAAGIDQNTLSKTNQSSLVTSVDVSGRYKNEDSEYKLVLRDTSSKNFVATSNSQSILSAAYVDYRDITSRMGLRVGRQSAIGGSMFGLFDGVSFTMPIANQYKVSATLGVPANQLVSAPSQRMAGVMLEADSLFEHWGGNLSLIDQTTEGISDRRAVGLEVRYFGENLSMFSQVDYEVNFGALNAATLQGSMQGPFGTTITMLLDDRKAPSLQLSDALISSGATSLKTLLQLRSLAEVQGLALDTTARAKQAMLSFSRPLSPKWQGSMDFRYSDVGALPAVGNFQAMPATGAQYNFSLQLTGSNLYSSRDINGFNASVLSSDTLRGTQLAYSNLTGFMDNKASFEPSLRVYTQTDNTSNKVLRVSPGLRLSYKLSERASLLGETIYELSKTEGPTGHDDSSSYFFYFGYRYDFFK
jgi:hypothetical protein